MTDRFDAAWLDLQHRVHELLGWRVLAWTELRGGTNNRLFRMETDAGTPLLAKLYHRDRWDRLGREYAMLSYLRDRGLHGVPRPYLRCDAHSYAVYSLESGHTIPPPELQGNHLRAAAAFAAALHRIDRDEAGAALPPAIGACFSPAEHLEQIDAGLRAFEEFAAGREAPEQLRAFSREIRLREAIADLVARATARIAREELTEPLPPASWRLSSGDFGVHNLLVDRDGAVTLVDFEMSGWDDPARCVMGFVAHGGSEGLTRAGAEHFLGSYAAARGLSDEEAARFERVGALAEIEWVAIYARALTAETIAAKQFAVPDFDLDGYIGTVLGKIRARLARAAGGVTYRLSTSS
jgi:aminoglycoside phosphotransferase (APT) family kinase protein